MQRAGQNQRRFNLFIRIRSSDLHFFGLDITTFTYDDKDDRVELIEFSAINNAFRSLAYATMVEALVKILLLRKYPVRNRKERLEIEQGS